MLTPSAAKFLIDSHNVNTAFYQDVQKLKNVTCKGVQAVWQVLTIKII